MKKVLKFLTVFLLALTLVACDKNKVNVPKFSEKDELKLTVDELSELIGALEINELVSLTKYFRFNLN